MALGIWISAIRLRTLPLALAAISVGSSFAFYEGKGDPSILTLTLITSLMLQILSNLANDYGDFEHGIDDKSRVGPERAMQSGRISKKQMLVGIVIATLLAFLFGCLLLIKAFYPDHIGQLFVFLGLGILSILGAYKYTAGKNPYGYRAFGDLAVFIFFGIIGVFGSYWIFTKSFNIYVLLSAFGFGLLIVSVLNLNNMRDLEADKAAGKRTLAVVLGIKQAMIYQSFLISAGALGVIISYMGFLPIKVGLGSIIIAFILFRLLNSIVKKEGVALDQYLSKVAVITLILSLLPWFSIIMDL